MLESKGVEHMEQQLTQLGLSRNAAHLYLALLETGESSISKLVERTGLHHQLIYNAAAELKEISLATFSIQRGKRYFEASSPQILLELQKEKLASVEKLLPALLSKYQRGEKPLIFVYSGDEEFRKARQKIINSVRKDDYFYIIGSGGKLFMQAMEGGYQQSEKIRIKRRVKKRLIGFEDTQDYENSYRKTAQLEERRYLPGAFESPTTTIFGGEYLAFILWTQPTTTVLIKSLELVDSHKKYFDVLWRAAY